MLDIRMYRGKTRKEALCNARVAHGSNFTILSEKEVSKGGIAGIIGGKNGRTEYEVRIMLQSQNYTVLDEKPRGMRDPELAKHTPVKTEEIDQRIYAINKAAPRDVPRSSPREAREIPREAPAPITEAANAFGNKLDNLEQKFEMLMSMMMETRAKEAAPPTEEPPVRRERAVEPEALRESTYARPVPVLNDNAGIAEDDSFADVPLFRSAMAERPAKKKESAASAAREVYYTEAHTAEKAPKADEAAGDAISRHLSLLRRREFPEDAIDELRDYLYRQSDARFYQDNETVKAAIEKYFDANLFLSKGIALSQRKKIIMLVGPTGVGKTTTIPKLASLFRTVREDMKFVTLDCYRIAAEEQLRRYADIMKVPFAICRNPESFREEVLSFKGNGIIFVDSVGRSPKNAQEIMEVSKYIKNAGRIDMDIQLVLSATTKYHDALDIIDNFKMLNYSGAIITKLDETNYIGSVLSAVIKSRTALSYLCVGQSVPKDIIEAAKGKAHLMDRIYGV
ncbi:MAG: hypothetical protein AABZ39_12585 [Spirochaetota bacterium]